VIGGLMVVFAMVLVVAALLPKRAVPTTQHVHSTRVESNKFLEEANAFFNPPPEHDAPPRLPLSPDAIFAQASPAVVEVVVTDRQDRVISRGSGFLVSGDRLVATNYHVIEKADSAHVVLAETTPLLVDGVAAMDPVADLAILKVAGTGPIRIRPLELQTDGLPPVGSKVYAIGSPLKLANTLSDGLVSGHRELRGMM